MAYLNTETNQYPISEQDIRNEFPTTSFSYPFQPPENYVYVFPHPVPTEYDPKSEQYVEDTPVLTDKGHWEQRWKIVPKYVEYTNNDNVLVTVADQIAAADEYERLRNVPTQVSPRQIRQALTRANLRTQVEAAVTAGDQDIKDWWEFATQIERSHPMVVGMATSLNITERELDDLFTLAGTL